MTDFYLTGVGSFFPPKTAVSTAVERGCYAAEKSEQSGLIEVSCARDHTAPAMALAAGRTALNTAGLRGDEVSLLLHAVAVYNGLDGWNSASYIQNELLSGAGLAFEVRQLSNGAVGAVELATSFLSAVPGRNHALITTADVFLEPVWNRWSADPGLVFADGASAAVISTNPGLAAVVGLHTFSDSGLEAMVRGASPFAQSAGRAQWPTSLGERYREFFDGVDRESASKRLAAGVQLATNGALTESGLEVSDIDVVVTPNFGLPLLDRQCLAPLGITLSDTIWCEWGRYTGHAGAADQFGGVDYLIRSGRVASGQTVLVLGIGAGFVWTSMILRILEHEIAS